MNSTVAARHVGRVPYAGRVDDRFATVDGGQTNGAIDLLVQGDRALKAQNQLFPQRVNLPGIPRLCERVHGHQATLGAVRSVSFGV